MIHFVVLAGAPTAVERLSSRLVPSLEATRYFDGACSEATVRTNWAAAAISVPDPLCATRLLVDGDTMIVTNGPSHGVGFDQRRLPTELLERFRHGGSAAVARILSGVYNFVGVDPAHGLRAFVDFSGRVPMYWHRGSDYAIFSNRPSTIASVAGLTSWDLRALAWLFGQNLRGERLPTAGVTYLLPASEAHVALADGRVDLATSPTSVWPAASDDAPRDNLSADEWDEVSASLIANFASLGTLDRPLQLLLTGGKDSRLCLALAKAAGVEDRITTVTRGPANGPEVECAAEVARVAGFAHKWLDTESRPAVRALDVGEGVDAERIWRRLRQHSYRYDAVVSPWAGANDRLRRTSFVIEGVGGELYRRGNDKRFRGADFRSPDEMAQILRDSGNWAGVLQREERKFQETWLSSWTRTESRSVRLDALPEKLYVDYRLGHWSGPLSQSKAGYIAATPLISATAARKNLELSAAVRSNERLHYEVMCRAAPELVTVPFMNDTWAPAIRATSPLDLPDQPFPTTQAPTHRVLGTWQYDFVEHQTDEILQLFDEAERKTEFGSISDVEQLEKAVRMVARRGAPNIRAVLAGIGISLALLGRAERVVDHCPEEPE